MRPGSRCQSGARRQQRGPRNRERGRRIRPQRRPSAGCDGGSSCGRRCRRHPGCGNGSGPGHPCCSGPGWCCRCPCSSRHRPSRCCRRGRNRRTGPPGEAGGAGGTGGAGGQRRGTRRRRAAQQRCPARPCGCSRRRSSGQCDRTKTRLRQTPFSAGRSLTGASAGDPVRSSANRGPRARGPGIQDGFSGRPVCCSDRWCTPSTCGTGSPWWICPSWGR